MFPENGNPYGDHLQNLLPKFAKFNGISEAEQSIHHLINFSMHSLVVGRQGGSILVRPPGLPGNGVRALA